MNSIIQKQPGVFCSDSKNDGLPESLSCNDCISRGRVYHSMTASKSSRDLLDGRSSTGPLGRKGTQARNKHQGLHRPDAGSRHCFWKPDFRSYSTAKPSSPQPPQPWIAKSPENPRTKK